MFWKKFKFLFVGWGGGSVGTAFAAQAWGHE